MVEWTYPSYQEALFTPGNSPFNAFRRNWNYMLFRGKHNATGWTHSRTLDRPNSEMTPRPLPDSTQRFFTVVGRVYRSNVFSCNWAWWRTCGGRVSFRATKRYALRAISLARTPCRALISRTTRALGMVCGGGGMYVGTSKLLCCNL